MGVVMNLVRDYNLRGKLNEVILDRNRRRL